MTMDGGWGLILATVIGVVLVWIGNMAAKHFGNSEEAADGAHDRINELSDKLANLAMDLLKHQRYVAENYAKTTALERIESKLDRLLERQGGVRHE
jgi:hypothetical protein